MSLRGKIISRNPLIIISSMRTPFLLGIASKFPQYFVNKKSFHILSPSWTLINNVQNIKGQLSQAQKIIPNAFFLILANDEAEYVHLTWHGIPCLLANTNIFINEKDFRPIDIEKRYSAVYNAALQPYKRHELCACINNLALIYYIWSNTTENEKYESKIKSLLPSAQFLNEDVNEVYRRLTSFEVAEANSSSAVGLCLSAIEGPMRASVEYLLCGIPVVSTLSLGGRQRYFNSFNSILVDSDPNKIANAVKKMESRSIPKKDIRSEILSIIHFERSNFLTSLNYLFWELFKIDNIFNDFSIFEDSLIYKSWDEWQTYLLKS